MKWRLFFLIILSMSVKPFYGGQAVVQGVMMKGPHHYAVSVRTSKGILTKVTPHVSLTKKHPVFNLPFLRGIIVLIDMMIIGYKSIYYSADVALEDDEEESSSLSNWALAGTMLFSMAFGILLFKFLPLGVARLVNMLIPVSTVVFNLIDGVVSAAIFILYLYLVGLYKDMQELFRYHGAEHKAINCYEKDKPLSLSNIFVQTSVHKRCGTTFMFVVIFISLLVYLFIPKDLPFFVNLALRIALVPLIAGISFELQRYSATHNNVLLNLLVKPGLAMQALTVKEPNAKQIKTGKAALEAVLNA